MFLDEYQAWLDAADREHSPNEFAHWVAAKHDIHWQWIKGHAGHEVQEVADKAARTIAGAGKVDNEMLDEMVVDLGVTEL